MANVDRSKGMVMAKKKGAGSLADALP
jgi:hypothetical protein